MKILYYDCFSGISGDMNLAAMLELGMPEKYLKEQLSKLKINNFELIAEKNEINKIAGTKVKVKHTKEDKKHRNISDIKEIINNSDLNKNIKQTSIKIFEKIAVAEAHIHQTTTEKIHFHEVGAVDSIVDIVGAAIGIDYLKPDKIVCSTIELGKGFVKCAHGIIPVPAPATIEILKNIPVSIGNQNFEATTPTGAAILATIVDEFSDKIDINIEKIAYALGHKKSEKPNMLRVLLGNPEKKKSYIIECNIDDMNPEFYGFISEKLFKAGASDVYYTSIFMKKNRPGIKLSVLCKEKLDLLKNIILTETTTFGLRTFPVEKTELEREFSTKSTKYGLVKLKSGFLNGERIKLKPEYEDCRKLANENNVSIGEIYRTINNLVLNYNK